MCVAAAQQKKAGLVVDTEDSSLIDAVVRDYNSSLVFGPSDDRMAYTIRDPLTSGLSDVSRSCPAAAVALMMKLMNSTATRLLPLWPFIIRSTSPRVDLIKWVANIRP